MPKGPYKLTPETHDRIITAIRAGAYIETAAATAGIRKDTLYRWLRKGAKSKGGPCKRFHDEVYRALGTAELRDVALIGKAAEEHWQAAAWRLERKFPERYARRDHVIVEQKTRAEIEAALDRLRSKLSPDEYERVLVALADDQSGSASAAARSDDEADSGPLH